MGSGRLEYSNSRVNTGYVNFYCSDKRNLKRNMKESSSYKTYLYSNLEKYKGKWIVILNENIIASGKDIKKILAEAKKKHPNKKFMLAKVPKEETLIY